MTPPIDIFRLESSDSILWLASAATLDDAKAIIQKISAQPSAQYIVLNQNTGNKLVITRHQLEDANGTPPDRKSAIERDTQWTMQN